MNHPRSSSILDLTLGEFLQRLGGSEPTPGGGAAAAVAGAVGAALIRMTANLTIGRPRLADVEEQATSIEQRAADLVQRLSRLGDADAEAFERVTAAYRLPRADDEQKAARSDAIQAALLVAADVPLETARICSQVIELADEA
ncbi:MAG TPA: cyclodeaminase/cyclohydrolase family protein, partial [Chloroflexota bacterium]